MPFQNISYAQTALKFPLTFLHLICPDFFAQNLALGKGTLSVDRADPVK